jgi:HAD superfamily hydrolase (TIGR01549 family)
MKENIKAVLFDVDGTLFDRGLAQRKVLEIIVRQFSHIFGGFEMQCVAKAFAESDRITTEEFEAGAPSNSLRRKRSRLFLQLLGLREDEDLADAITAAYVRDYPAVDAAMAGAVPLVKELSELFIVGVVSNGLPDVQYRKLEAIGLQQVLSCIVLSEEIGIRKPDPRIFCHAVQLLQLQPSDCLYVGDSYASDVVGAKASGMLTCWLNRGQSVTPSERAKADFVVSSLKQLGEILRADL